jgi:hypothetical protein
MVSVCGPTDKLTYPCVKGHGAKAAPSSAQEKVIVTPANGAVSENTKFAVVAVELSVGTFTNSTSGGVSSYKIAALTHVLV